MNIACPKCGQADDVGAVDNLDGIVRCDECGTSFTLAVGGTNQNRNGRLKRLFENSAHSLLECEYIKEIRKMKRSSQSYLSIFLTLTLLPPLASFARSRVNTIGGSKQIMLQGDAQQAQPTPPKLSPYEWLTPEPAESREWTSSKGTKLTGKCLRFNRYNVVIEADKTFTIARNRLSKEDNSYLLDIEKAKTDELIAQWRETQKSALGGNSPSPGGGCQKCAGTGMMKVRRKTTAIHGGLRDSVGARGGVNMVETTVRCTSCNGTGKKSSGAFTNPNVSYTPNGVPIPESYMSDVPGVMTGIRVKCWHCGGSGYVGGLMGAVQSRADGREPQRCSSCQGTGVIKSR